MASLHEIVFYFTMYIFLEYVCASREKAYRMDFRMHVIKRLEHHVTYAKQDCFIVDVTMVYIGACQEIFNGIHPFHPIIS